MTQILFAVIAFTGFAGVAYTVYGLIKLNDYFYEVYEYDRDPHT